ncbi:MAG: hypothetical protein ACI9KE_000939 [Polyangiales bacterium]|jgi:hypothetical protein
MSLTRSAVALFSLVLACSSSTAVQDAAVTDVPGRDTPSTDAPTPDARFGECLVPTDCFLLPESCCGSCGQPSRTDIDSVPLAGVDAQRSMACAEPVPCPACEGQPDVTLLADCSMASCTVFDLDPPNGPPPGLSACEDDTDCIIRAAECCECGATITEETVVALNVEIRGGYEPFVCEPGTGCPECAPLYPDNLVARCIGDGPAARCTVVNTDR